MKNRNVSVYIRTMVISDLMGAPVSVHYTISGPLKKQKHRPRVKTLERDGEQYTATRFYVRVRGEIYRLYRRVFLYQAQPKKYVSEYITHTRAGPHGWRL